MRISDWSSDVCSSELQALRHGFPVLDPTVADIATDLLDERLLPVGGAVGHDEALDLQAVGQHPAHELRQLVLALALRAGVVHRDQAADRKDRKSTRLNSSH